MNDDQCCYGFGRCVEMAAVGVRMMMVINNMISIIHVKDVKTFLPAFSLQLLFKTLKLFLNAVN